MSNKAISDEQLIVALLSHGTKREAAEAAGIAERTMYDRMNDGEFQALYKAAKADLLRAAVVELNNSMQEAITTIADIMRDTNNNPAVRLQAAQTILNTTGKYTQRLQEAEILVRMQLESNRFSFM